MGTSRWQSQEKLDVLGLNPAEHVGGDPHLGSRAVDAIGVDTWLKTEP